MAIEIREIVIRAKVGESAVSAEQIETLVRNLKDAILEECLERIREQLRETTER
ncbi:DUF5908 family protein [Methylomagnum sp.]